MQGINQGLRKSYSLKIISCKMGFSEYVDTGRVVLEVTSREKPSVTATGFAISLMKKCQS